MAKNFYEVLGVEKTASDAELKSAYRNLAKKYHPDVYAKKSDAEKKDAEAKFKEIGEAYAVLSDEQKRSYYDQFGEAGAAYAGAGGGPQDPNWQKQWAQWSAGGFEDIFNDIFGGGSKARQDMKVVGEDITIQLTISFEEAAFGCEKKIAVDRTERCAACGGSGASNNSSIKECPRCKGTGTVTMTQQSMFGATKVSRPCPDCHGRGKIITDKCKVCKGSGYVNKTREINIKVPAGVDTNQVMSYKGEGHSGVNGGSPGNLIVVINVRPHELFERRGADLYVEMPINIFEAAAGAKIKVPSLTDEMVTLQVPAGSQTGDILRVKGYGIQLLKRESFGDLYVTINVEMPRNLNRKQADLLKKFTDSTEDIQYPERYKFGKKYLGKK